MSRIHERMIIYISSFWQIVTGGITAWLYLSNIESYFGLGPESSVIGSFVFLYGMTYVTIGIINIILAYKYVLNNTVQKKIPIYWTILCILFFLLTDYISLMFLILAVVISISKNQSINIKRNKRISEFTTRGEML